MLSLVQSVQSVWFSSRKSLPMIGIGLAVLSGGCSADIARFDFAGLNDKGTTTAAIPPVPSEPVGQRSNLIGQETADANAGYPGYQSPGGTYYPPPSNYAPSANTAPPVVSQPLDSQPAPAQPATVAPIAPQRPAVAALPPQGSRAAAPAPVTAAPVLEERAEVTRGEQIEVQAGDTLYGLSRRHKVAIADLIAVNNLTGPMIKPGQSLYIPATKTTHRPAEPVTVVSADIPANWTGTYTIKTGDSLYAIASRYGLRSADIRRYNGIRDVRRIRPGTVLRLPAGTGDGTVVASGRPATIPSGTPQPTYSVGPDSAPAPVASGPAPAILNGRSPTTTNRTQLRTAVARPLNTANDAQPSSIGSPSRPGSGSVASTDKLRWPVEGKIISAFGQRPDGTHNDGVNLAVPLGTDVHAAEAGTVAYAGNELKGYGNLILVRHDNGWVTAYAHANEMLVSRGDVVRRGQVIAKAGKTGQVDQPQLHFELRQGQKPVDPTPFMERL